MSAGLQDGRNRKNQIKLSKVVKEEQKNSVKKNISLCTTAVLALIADDERYDHFDLFELMGTGTTEKLRENLPPRLENSQTKNV